MTMIDWSLSACSDYSISFHFYFKVFLLFRNQILAIREVVDDLNVHSQVQTIYGQRIF
jgi:hypothetical protein